VPSITEILTSAEGRSAAAWARRRRHERLVAEFPDLPDMRVLDLGGEPHTWTGSNPRPREVVLLNLPRPAEAQARQLSGRPEWEWMTPVAGDACDPPEEVREGGFDLVYSNSVIEHVGGHHRRRALAHYAQALAEHHWVQTPNRWFPLEPHWLCPGFQYLPTRGRAAVTRTWPIGAYTARRESLRQRMGDAMEVELLSASELQWYFEDSRIVRERVAGLPKSLIAIR
jgi:methyltransferase family protein